ncbi:hypothetical protein [Streptomyces sp. NRRL S-1521]|uniref:hypothetical protein n=1 Tax=Streptomyces sp. NRRL S-1521 TaxID=1609100 RepID=UPI000746B8EF|nr:hypothetical protein [Streptomyces sp. NRRL S-1521]KUL62711.1 hypothetical protein ADL30_04755 [Streptomyces sp. NRRL S-1521]
MPGAGGGEPYRIVVDESSFDFRGLTEERLTDLLEDFGDALEDLSEQHAVAVSPLWMEVECADGRELYDVLYEGEAPRAGRDARLRMIRLMDRCPSWDTDVAGLPEQVEVAGSAQELAWSLCYAWWRARQGQHITCLVFPDGDRRGWLPVSAVDVATGEPVTEEVFHLAEASALSEFWRSLFTREEVPEPEFFGRAHTAFPRLAFADSLSFRKFDGTYAEMRDWVVQVLSVVHDHFADALARHKGQPHQVQAELGRFGLDLSPESPNTRSKPRAMKQREVDHEGETYRCEWHGKKERHRNRIHFSLPDTRLGGRILIGIFVDHLDT